MARGICEGLREFGDHGSGVHSFRRGHSCDSTPEVGFERASDGSDHSPRLGTPRRHRPPCPPAKPPISHWSRDRPPPNAFRAGSDRFRWPGTDSSAMRWRRDAERAPDLTDDGPRDNWAPGTTGRREAGRRGAREAGRPGRELRARSEQWDSYARSTLSNSRVFRPFSHFRALSYTSSTVRESE